MATLASDLVTLEQYAAQPDHAPSELVQGRIVSMNRPTPRHGQICVRVVLLVGAHVQSRDLGHLVANYAGVVTARDPDSVRGADVAYYSYARFPHGPLLDGYSSVAPDLVLEILSPQDRRVAMFMKIAEYLEAGVRNVCVLDDAARTVEVFRPDRPTELVTSADEFTIPEILADFRITAARFFE